MSTSATDETVRLVLRPRAPGYVTCYMGPAGHMRLTYIPATLAPDGKSIVLHWEMFGDDRTTCATMIARYRSGRAPTLHEFKGCDL